MGQRELDNQGLLRRIAELEDLARQPVERPLTLNEIETQQRALAFLETARGELVSTKHQAAPVRDSVIRSYLSAQVEIDTILSPRVDPNDGWVKLVDRAPAGRTIVDTQLMRLEFTDCGDLVSLGYKPRKCELVAQLAADAGAWLFASNWVADSAPFVLARTPGFLRIRFAESTAAETTASESSRIQLDKIFSVKSGIGAYLNDSTTGFSLEIKRKNSKVAEVSAPLNTLPSFKLRQVILLPSGVAAMASVAPLLSFGGVGKADLDFTTAEFTANSLPGGLFGVRLVDGLDDFTVDFRSSKPILRVEARQLFDFTLADSIAADVVAADGVAAVGDNKIYLGMEFELEIDAATLVDEDHPFTIFCSIV